jgi:hypothetical protein
VTEFGIEIEVILDSLNASSPILFTEGSITNFPVQPSLLVTLPAGISTEYVPPVQGNVFTSAFASLKEMEVTASKIRKVVILRLTLIS